MFNNNHMKPTIIKVTVLTQTNTSISFIGAGQYCQDVRSGKFLMRTSSLNAHDAFIDIETGQFVNANSNLQLKLLPKGSVVAIKTQN